jgi:hypothetical protein
MDQKTIYSPSPATVTLKAFIPPCIVGPMLIAGFYWLSESKENAHPSMDDLIQLYIRVLFITLFWGGLFAYPMILGVRASYDRWADTKPNRCIKTVDVLVVCFMFLSVFCSALYLLKDQSLGSIFINSISMSLFYLLPHWFFGTEWIFEGSTLSDDTIDISM